MPAATPVTTPVPAPTVQIVLSLLLHVPPDVASLSDIVNPEHTVVAPEMGDGNALTVTVAVL